MKKYYSIHDDIEQVFCDINECNECDGTDQSGEPNGYGCEDQEDFCGDEQHQLVENADCTIFVSLEDAEIMQKTIASLKCEVNNLKVLNKVLEDKT